MKVAPGAADGGSGGRHLVAPSDMSVANDALCAARRKRAVALSGLSSGLLGVSDLLELAEDEPALRRIALRTIIAELGASQRRCDQLVSIFRRLAGAPASRVRERKLTLGWICDRRAGDARLTALAEVVVACTPGLLLDADGWPYASRGADSNDAAQS